MTESASSLKIIKSTWGISIRLTARHTGSDLVSSQYLVTDRIGFNINSIGIKLSEEDVLMLIAGLRWISKYIENEIDGGKSIVIELVKVEFVDTDFQPEGFYYGIAKWASNHFHFTLPDYTVVFNEKENKYMFPDIKLGNLKKNERKRI